MSSENLTLQKKEQACFFMLLRREYLSLITAAKISIEPSIHLRRDSIGVLVISQVYLGGFASLTKRIAVPKGFTFENRTIMLIFTDFYLSAETI